METPIQWPVMADMFDDGSHFLASRVFPNMVKHSGWHDFHSWACCQISATDKTLDLEEKNILSNMIVTLQLSQYSEEYRDLSALPFMPDTIKTHYKQVRP